MRKTCSTVGVLVLALLLGALLAAGPALADAIVGDPPGPLWKGHEISGTAKYLGDEGDAGVFAMKSTDPRFRGTMYVYVTEFLAADAYAYAYGTYDIYNDAGVLTWHSDYWYSTYGPGSLQDPMMPNAALGWNWAEGRGPYEGVTSYSVNHAGAGWLASFAWKGWVYE
jgi:hypothetical protein